MDFSDTRPVVSLEDKRIKHPPQSNMSIWVPLDPSAAGHVSKLLADIAVMMREFKGLTYYDAAVGALGCEGGAEPSLWSARIRLSEADIEPEQEEEFRSQIYGRMCAVLGPFVLDPVKYGSKPGAFHPLGGSDGTEVAFLSGRRIVSILEAPEAAKPFMSMTRVKEGWLATPLSGRFSSEPGVMTLTEKNGRFTLTAPPPLESRTHEDIVIRFFKDSSVAAYKDMPLLISVEGKVREDENQLWKKLALPILDRKDLESLPQIEEELKARGGSWSAVEAALKGSSSTCCLQ